MASPSLENHVKMRIHDVPKCSTWQIERERESFTETESSSGQKPRTPMPILSVRVVVQTGRTHCPYSFVLECSMTFHLRAGGDVTSGECVETKSLYGSGCAAVCT
jgi:hypothetical protein